jgi:hypothetical protein
MPNSPAQNTVTVSFTLPRKLLDAVETEARLNMSNKSDVIRRALMNYLTPAERDLVLKEIAPTSSPAKEYRLTKPPRRPKT